MKNEGRRSNGSGVGRTVHHACGGSDLLAGIRRGGDGSSALVPNLGAAVSSPAVARGVVYVGSVGGDLYAVDAVTGAIRWQTVLSGTVTSLTVDKGVVYAGSDTWLYSVTG